jgi:hypothetical protein
MSAFHGWNAGTRIPTKHHLTSVLPITN